MRNTTQCAAWVLVTSLVISASGCGADDGLDRRYPISGQVTYNGQPLAEGTISFYPQDPDGQGASGQIRDGRYSNVTTLQPGDGILPGTYHVTVASREGMDESQIETMGGMADQVSVAKASAKAKSLIPLKYANVLTSGLQYEVKPERNTFDIHLMDD